ncbi:MAG: glycosyl hydrolase, partial [Firmicutes bacterium]|nr:glycosyl hydrolase [Bacillota bacterium]
MRRAFCLLIAVSLGVPLSAQRQQRQRPQPQPAEAALAPEARLLPEVEAAHLRGMKARSIGPAVMSGRVSDIALDPTQPAVFYVALGTGGVMKTSDGGTSWEAIFENQPVAAIGDIAVAASDPRIVWVGTGEANDRNSSSWGNGVYRSTDGGETWQHVGLKNSKTIARILVHPTDPNTVWVAAMGDLWNWNEERGCYKTTDGGKTWRKVLAAVPPYDTRVGCGDLALDPSNPNVLYAALYARRRTPWSFAYGPRATDGQD